MARFCYIGIDGGGTKTRGVAMDENGTVLCRAEAESINYCSVGMDAAILALSRVVNTLSANADLPVAALAVGSSALDERIRDDLYRTFLSRMEEDPVLSAIPTKVVKSDAYMALLALCGEERGAILISGTGVMGLAADEGKLHSVAGWGDLFGDRGSGYWIAREALCAALDYIDGLDPAGEALFYAMCEFFDLKNAGELISEVYAPEFEKSRLAAFAECVSALATHKDARSVQILDRAANELIRYAESLGAYLGHAPFALGFYGSVLTKNQHVLQRVQNALHHSLPQAEIRLPQTAAEDAAALYLIQRRPS